VNNHDEIFEKLEHEENQKATIISNLNVVNLTDDDDDNNNNNGNGELKLAIKICVVYYLKEKRTLSWRIHQLSGEFNVYICCCYFFFRLCFSSF
jgi:hypothetical protein